MVTFALSPGLLLFMYTYCNTDSLLAFRLCDQQYCRVSVVTILRRKARTELVDEDSSVGVATCCGLEGPGIESRLERDFRHPSRQALVPIHPPVRLVPGLLPGVKWPGRSVDHPRPSSAEVEERVELYLISPLVLRGLIYGEDHLSRTKLYFLTQCLATVRSPVIGHTAVCPTVCCVSNSVLCSEPSSVDICYTNTNESTLSGCVQQCAVCPTAWCVLNQVL
jgi:hypothetical protein